MRLQLPFCSRPAQVTKEVRAGQYRLSAYFLAKTAVSVPFESTIAIIFTVIIYNMIGFQVMPRQPSCIAEPNCVSAC